MSVRASEVHSDRTKPISISKSFVEGNKFIKWDDDDMVLVTLHIDPKGYILHWIDQHKVVGYIDISQINDIRTGKYARQPKDSRIRDTVLATSQESQPENKLLTICYGNVDMVNVNFINFASLGREVDKKFIEVLFACAMNIQATNASPMGMLEKYHAILSTVTESAGKIHVKRVMKMLAHKDDYKRVEQALESERMPSKKHDSITDAHFKLDNFLRLYHKLCGRHDVDAIFLKLSSSGQYISADKFTTFLNQEQRDPRLNEVLFPYYDIKKASALIRQFEPIKKLADDGRLSCEGFLRFLLSEENAVMPHEKFGVFHDMTQPLSHYFINSSHNTYLTGHQLHGKSSVEIYRQVLLSGCRCIELDVWDGKGVDEEPLITHGYTMCTEVSCKEVLEAIAEVAFKTSDYPVILSFENHLSSKQQVKLARYCVSVFGDMMLTDALDSNPLEVGVPLPSPESLKRRILVKNKKRHNNDADTVDKKVADGGDNRSALAGTLSDSSNLVQPSVGQDSTSSGKDILDSLEWELDSVVLDESKTEEYLKKRKKVMEEKGTAGQEVEAGQDMSALVNYIEPVRFQSFEKHASRNRSYECISFVETQATTILKSHPVDFVDFNKRQLSRVYPKGTRIDSSNCIPQIYWNAGCQIVALNFQTLDFPMQLNLGLFEYNARCGYLLKPHVMRKSKNAFDPFTVLTFDGIVAVTLQVRVISAQFISDRRCGSYVEVNMFGLPADTVRNKFRTKVVLNNAINPIYDEEPFVFKKVIMPSLATIHLAVYNKTGGLLGHRFLPVEGLQSGYRHVGLRNELNQPQGLATLFVYFKIEDYIMDKFADIADALSNPIDYQSKLENRDGQLSALEDNAMNSQDFNGQRILRATACRSVEMNSSVLSVVQSRVVTEWSTIDHCHSLPRSSSSKLRQPIRRNYLSLVNLGLSEKQCSDIKIRSISVPVNPQKAVISKDITNGKPTTRLRDPDIIEMLTVTQLKKTKCYVERSALNKKELDSLKRKHDKMIQTKLETQQENFTKLANSLKTQTGILLIDRAMRVHLVGSKDMSFVDTKDQMSNYHSEYSAKLQCLRSRNYDEILALCFEQLRARYDLQWRHLENTYGFIKEIAEKKHKRQLARLTELYELELGDLKRQLNLEIWEELKSLGHKYVEKTELSRMRQETKERHMQSAVHQELKLNYLFVNLKQEANNVHEELLQQIALDKNKAIDSLRKLHADNHAEAVLKYQKILFNSKVARRSSLSYSNSDSNVDLSAAAASRAAVTEDIWRTTSVSCLSSGEVHNWCSTVSSSSSSWSEVDRSWEEDKD